MEIAEIVEKYEEYLEKFAKTQGITKEEAEEYQAVKQYKAWLEEEYNVKMGR